MHRRLSFLAASIAVLTGFSEGAVVPTFRTVTLESPQSALPNILVVLTDDQDAGSMWAMPQTEALWGSGGVTFTTAFVANPLCCPARATILTGQFSHNNGVWDVKPPLNYQALNYGTTLPVWLQAAGYHTAHLGKFLNGYGEVLAPGQSGQPCRVIPAGWNEWLAWLDPPAYKNYVVNDQGTIRKYGNGVPPQGCTVDASTSSVYGTDLLSQRAVAFVNSRAGNPQPWFLVVATGAPHEWGQPGKDTSPLPAQRHAGAFASQPFVAGPTYNEADVSDKPLFVQQLPLFTPSQTSLHATIYRKRLETLLAVDEAIEAIEQALVATGQAGNTVRVFTSDNGWTVDHRIPWRKFAVYEDSIRVPLIVHGPGYPAGLVRSELVANVDLAPTIAALAGATPTRTMDGADLGPLLRGETVPWRSALLLESRARSSYDAVRTADHIYVEHATGELELYDLAIDPGQLESKHADPLYAALKASLAAQLAPLKTCVAAGCWVP